MESITEHTEHNIEPALCNMKMTALGSDLFTTILTETSQNFYAFSHSARKVPQLSGAAKSRNRQATRLDLSYRALLESMRALSKRDKKHLRRDAAERNEPVSITVYSDFAHFTRTLGGLNTNPDRLKDVVTGYLIDEISTLTAELDCMFYGEHVKRDFTPLRSLFFWSLRALNVPESNHDEQMHYGSVDRRIARSIEKAAIQPAETAVTQ